MAYVTGIRLSGDRVAWGGPGVASSSSCSEMDLDVIEEYLQEHSLDVHPVHMPSSPPTTMGHQVHSHQGSKITGQCVAVMMYESD